MGGCVSMLRLQDVVAVLLRARPDPHCNNAADRENSRAMAGDRD